MTEMPGIFIADAPGLDFLNSIATPVDEPVEWIGSGEDLLSWLAQAKMVDGSILEEFQRTSLPGELDSIAAQARALRGWFREFVKRHSGHSLKPDALAELEPINRILMRDEQYLQIVPTGGNSGGAALRLERSRRWRTPESLLLPIAESMAQVIAHEDFRHVRGCEGHNCTLIFVDRTRGRARRWCSMAVCGNRAKQAAHRNRASAGHS